MEQFILGELGIIEGIYEYIHEYDADINNKVLTELLATVGDNTALLTRPDLDNLIDHTKQS